MTLHAGVTAGNVVCKQREWDELERQRPGFHQLLHAGIGTEQEAERLARGTSGDDYVRWGGKKLAMRARQPDGRTGPPRPHA